MNLYVPDRKVRGSHADKPWFSVRIDAAREAMLNARSSFRASETQAVRERYQRARRAFYRAPRLTRRRHQQQHINDLMRDSGNSASWWGLVRLLLPKR